MMFQSTVRYLCLSLLIFQCGFAGAQAEPPNELFEYVTQARKSASALANNPKAAVYPIQLNRKVMALGVGSTIRFPLPDGSVLNIVITKKRITQNGDTQIEGTFAEDGIAIVTYGKNSTYANFSGKDHNYGIGIDEHREAFLVDYQKSDFDVDLGDDMRFPDTVKAPSTIGEPLPKPQQNSKEVGAMGKSEVTLLAIYSAEFASGFANPITRINQMVAFTNAAYDRSGVLIELKLTHAQQVNFTNGASIGTLLNQVTFGQGDFSGVHAIRDMYFTDLVAVLPFTSSGSVAGVAWVNGDDDDFGFSVTQFAVWGSDSVFAHELGHNLGSGHERLSANPSQPSPCSGGHTGYSCGHGNGSHGTIMSYLNDFAWGYVFSNPSLDCNGEPCGIASGQPNSADNKTSFNITGPLVEDFRIDTSNDDDKDGVKNDVDNCPLVKNPSQRDTNNDGEGDACDDDDDGDGVLDGPDNCQFDVNPGQEDSDGNGIGDACQDDSLCYPVTLEQSKAVLVCL